MVEGKKLDAQTTRAVETMCLMGLDADALTSSFPGYTREELEAVLARINEEKENMTENDHSPISSSTMGSISYNCS